MRQCTVTGFIHEKVKCPRGPGCAQEGVGLLGAPSIVRAMLTYPGFIGTSARIGLSIPYNPLRVKEIEIPLPQGPLSERIRLDKKGGQGYPMLSFRDRLVVESGTARAS